MKFGSVEIDFTGLAALIMALVAGWTALKGHSKVKEHKKRVRDDNEKSE